jgi:predicted nucleic acid-binding protein
MDEPRAPLIEAYLAGGDLLVPTVVIYEVYKFLRREVSEEWAQRAVARMRKAQIIPLDDSLAMEAAEASLEHRLPFADAVVFATARRFEAVLVTADRHFRGLPGVEYLGEQKK